MLTRAAGTGNRDRVLAVGQPAEPATPSRFRPTRRRVAALVAVVAGAAAVLVWARDDGGLHSWKDGPLVSGDSTQNSIPVDLDQPFTYGYAVVFNTTKRPAVLEAVRVRPALPEGMEIIDIQTVGPEARVANVATELAFPSSILKDHLRPLAGTTVPPRDDGEDTGEGLDIVFGLKVTKPGIYGFAQFDLDYRIGSTRHTVRLEHGFMACAPRAAHNGPNDCDHAFLDRLAEDL